MSSQMQEMRRKAGYWLRELREQRGLSQRELAAKVGAKYYTVVSQLEAGRGRIPPDRYFVWAAALEIEPREFVRILISFYDPVTHRILVQDNPTEKPDLQDEQDLLLIAAARVEDS